MARPPRGIRGTTLPSRILDIACRHKAAKLGISEYTIPMLERDSGLNHSVILRAAAYDSEQESGSRPTAETVKRLADTLEVSSDPDLEDAFYNAFRCASPRQVTQARSYVNQNDAEE